MQKKLAEDEEETFFGLWTGSKKTDLLIGFHRLWQQFQSQIIKHFIHSLRNKILIISQIIIPIMILLVNLLYIKYGDITPSDLPELSIDISRYGKNYIPFTTSDPNASPFSSVFSNQFKNYKDTQVFDLNIESLEPLCDYSRNSIENYLSCIGRNNLEMLNDNYLIAMDFSQKQSNITLTAHFNNQPYHIPPLALNALTNNLFKYYTNSSQNAINVINHPLPRTLIEKTKSTLTADQTSFNIASGLSFGFSFLIASFCSFLIKERVSNAKHLQFMNGCNVYIFWMAAFIWDLINYLITIIVAVILIVVNKDIN